MTTPARIVRGLRPQCRHCHRMLNLSEVIDEMFVRIAERLAAGERVELPGIGILRPKSVKERIIRTMPHRLRKLVSGWVEVNFRATTELKRRLNPNRPPTKLLEEEPDAKPATAVKPAATVKPTKRRARKRRARPGPSDN